jgi:hypothetical protein
VDIDAKIINDIRYALVECVNYLLRTRPDVGSRLTDQRDGYRKEFETWLGEQVYRIYVRDRTMAGYFDDIHGYKIKAEYLNDVNQLHAEYKAKLETAWGVISHYRDRLNLSADGLWLHVSPKGLPVTVKRRLYINCNPKHVDEVIKRLVQLMVTGFGASGPARIYFKFRDYRFVQPRNLIRADRIVVYYEDSPVTHEILRDWVTSIRQFLHPTEPLFTRQAVNGTGFAYEPLPEHQEYAKMHSGEEASFGQFIALVIARYLYPWCLRNRRLPRTSADFQQIAREIFYGKLINKHHFTF